MLRVAGSIDSFIWFDVKINLRHLLKEAIYEKNAFFIESFK